MERHWPVWKLKVAKCDLEEPAMVKPFCKGLMLHRAAAIALFATASTSWASTKDLLQNLVRTRHRVLSSCAKATVTQQLVKGSGHMPNPLGWPHWPLTEAWEYSGEKVRSTIETRTEAWDGALGQDLNQVSQPAHLDIYPSVSGTSAGQPHFFIYDPLNLVKAGYQVQCTLPGDLFSQNHWLTEIVPKMHPKVRVVTGGIQLNWKARLKGGTEDCDALVDPKRGYLIRDLTVTNRGQDKGEPEWALVSQRHVESEKQVGSVWFPVLSKSSIRLAGQKDRDYSEEFIVKATDLSADVSPEDFHLSSPGADVMIVGQRPPQESPDPSLKHASKTYVDHWLDVLKVLATVVSLVGVCTYGARLFSRQSGR